MIHPRRLAIPLLASCSMSICPALNAQVPGPGSGNQPALAADQSTSSNSPVAAQTKADIERMVQQASKNQSEDQKRRELVEARNLADTVIYQVEKAVKDQGNAIATGARSKIEGKITDLRQAITGGDTGRIQRLSEELQQAVAQGAQQPDQDRGGSNDRDHEGRPEGDVVEGEFHDA